MVVPFRQRRPTGPSVPTVGIPGDDAGGHPARGRVTIGLDIVRGIAHGVLASDATAPADSISLEKVTVQ